MKETKSRQHDVSQDFDWFLIALPHEETALP
jgi:hypothetical protein